MTRRQTTVEPLEQGERLFRELADTAPVLIWFSGPDKGCTWFNRGWLDFRGRAMSEEVGDGWADGVHPDDRADVVRDYSDAFDRREPFTMEYRLRRHDGEYRWILDSGVPRANPDGGFAGYIGGCVDITAQKEAESNARSMALDLESMVGERTRDLKDRNVDLRVAYDALESFTLVVGHDLKEPVRAIKAHIQQAIENQGGDSEVALQRAANAAERLEGMMRGLLELSRASLSHISGEDVPLPEALTDPTIQERYQDLAERRNATVDIDPRLPAVRATKELLAQIFGNLVLNAIRHHPGESPHVTIEDAGTTPEKKAHILVRDDGAGFPERILRALGAPEARILTPSGAGGFGLLIARRAAERLGGSLWVENAPTGGALAHVTLPLARSPALEA